MRKHTNPLTPYSPNPAAGDAFESNTALRGRNIAGEEAANRGVQDTFGDPMHAIAISNAQQSLLGARTDVSGMGAVLQGIKEATSGHRGKVGFQEPSADDPLALSPASWNPAGMTQSGAQADVQKVIAGGAMPGYATTGTPETQEAFRRRLLQGIKGARG